MAFPFAIVPVIKLIALGSIKFLFLLLGACFFPVSCLRLRDNTGSATTMTFCPTRSTKT